MSKINLILPVVLTATALVACAQPEKKGGDTKMAYVIDNTDAGFSKTGVWNGSVRDKPFHGDNYLWSPKDSESTARWSADSLSSGEYDVFVWFCASKDDDRATNAKYIIKHAEGKTAIVLNQKPSAGHHNKWYRLGTWSFDGVGEQYVELSNIIADHSVSADAVQFVRKP